MEEMHTCVMQAKEHQVYFLRWSIIEVTDLRDGGDVRGSPFTVIMVLEKG
jgi:hypothetical protein